MKHHPIVQGVLGSCFAASLCASACTTSVGSLGVEEETGEATGESGVGDGGVESETDSGGDDGAAEETDETSADGDASNASCGDGIVEGAEQCDDGNDVNGDGCEIDCVETTILEVHAGGSQSCVLLEGGGVKCWGAGGTAGYGDWQSIGDDEYLSAMGLVPIGEPVRQLAVGGVTCVVLEASSDVKCWGRNLEGQTGQGHQEGGSGIGDDLNELPELLPPIDLGGPVEKVAVGNMHVCALMQGGEVRCWGGGEFGILGSGNQENVGDDEVPSSVLPVDLGVAAKDIVTGASHTCVQTVDDDVICWGRNYVGQLGYGVDYDVGDDEVPSSMGLVPLGGKVDELVAGFAHNCARMETGQLKCWGGYHSNALGPGGNESIGDDEPASFGTNLVFGGPLVGMPMLGGHYGCGLREDGVIECWGDNQNGQLGLGHTISVEDPTSTPGVQIGEPAVALSVGSNHACALLDANRVICWGDGNDGKLGQGYSEADIGDNEFPEEWGPISLW